MIDGGPPPPSRDFFVSYSAADEEWAAWVAWQLEDARFSVLIQAWDFPAGSNWVRGTDEGIHRAAHTIVILSPEYVRSAFGTATWQAAWQADPTGERRKLLPVRVADVPMRGLLGNWSPVDVFDVAETRARERLLSAAGQAVSGGRVRPQQAPLLPTVPQAVAAPTRFPGGIWMVPTRMDPVVARPDKEKELVAALLDGGDGLVGVTTALEGAGGFGKSTLAEVVCQMPEVRERFRGGLLWATVGRDRDGPALAEILSDLCSRLSGQPIALSNPTAAGLRLAELIAGPDPTLLVADDVWNRRQLDPFLAAARRCRLLVTTRNRGVVPADVRSVEVDQMTDEEAAAVLRASKTAIPHDQLIRLIALTGRWPVLLRLARENIAEYVRDGADPAAAAAWLVERLEAGGPATLDVEDETSRDRAVALTVKASLELLSEEDQQRFAELAIFPEDVEVPVGVLELLWGATGKLGRPAMERLRVALTRLRLADGKWAAGQTPTLRLHDVVRSYIRHQVGNVAIDRSHRALIDAARKRLHSSGHHGQPSPWWSLPTDADYLASYIPYHLLNAGLTAEATALVTDLRWAEFTIRRTRSTLAVEADLATVGSAQADLLARALARISHLLPTDTTEGLASTLAARLHDVHDLKDVVQKYQACLPGLRLDALWPLPDQPHPEQRRALTGHTGWVLAVSCSPDGSLLASASDDATVRIWDVATGTETAVLHGRTNRIFGIAFSPDGSLLASAGDDATVRIWDVATGTETAVLYGHTGWVRAVAFSPDGHLIASASDDSTVRLWEVTTGTRSAVLIGHTDEAYSCTFSPDGRLVASTGSDGTVRIWDPQTATESTILTGHADEVYACSFSPDSRLLATAGDQTVRIWDMTRRACTTVLQGHTDSVRGAAFSSDGRLLASAGDDNTLRVWDLATHTQMAVFNDQDYPLNGCAFVPNSRLLASAGRDATIRLWELAADARSTVTTTLAGQADEAYSCAFSPDGRFIAVGGNGIIRIWETTTKASVGTLVGGHRDKVHSIVFSPDGRLLVSADETQMQVWDVATGHRCASIFGFMRKCCTFSSHGESILSADDAGTVRRWDLVSHHEDTVVSGYSRSMTKWMNSISSSPDGRLVAIANETAVQILDTSKGSQAATLPDSKVHATAFSPDGVFLASTSNDTAIRVWNVEAATENVVLSGHPERVNDISYSPDGTLIVSAGEGVVRVWDLATASCVTVLSTRRTLHQCAWHDRNLAIAGEAGTYLFKYIPAMGR